MDRELKELLDKLERTQQDGFNRLECKFDELQKSLQSHVVESVSRHGVVDAAARAAHRRIDELREDVRAAKDRGWTLWVALVIAVLSALGTMAMALFHKGA